MQPKIKNVLVASDALALKDAVMALSVASSISLSIDRAAFHAEPNMVSIALAAQSAILVAGRITEINRRHYDVVEQIGLLKAKLEAEKGKAEKASLRAESVAGKVAEERAMASAEEEKAKCSDQLRLAAEERANASDDALKLAKEVIAKLEVDLEESKKEKEIADLIY